MPNQTPSFRQIRIRVKRSKTVTKAVIVCALILSTVTLATLHSVLRETQERTEELRQQAAQLEQENAQLDEKIDALGSVDSVKDIAQEQLGLVDPDTVIIEPEN